MRLRLGREKSDGEEGERVRVRVLGEVDEGWRRWQCGLSTCPFYLKRRSGGVYIIRWGSWNRTPPLDFCLLNLKASRFKSFFSFFFLPTVIFGIFPVERLLVQLNFIDINLNHFCRCKFAECYQSVISNMSQAVTSVLCVSALFLLQDYQ